MKKLIIIAMLLQGCGQQNINTRTVSSTQPCSGSQVGSWRNVPNNNTLTLTAACAGTTNYCNEAFTYTAINSTTYQVTVSATNGGPECLPIGQTLCTAGFLSADVLDLNCGGGKNLTASYNRL